MPVQWQTFDFKFQGGVNDKNAPQILPVGLLTEGDNIRQRRTGEYVKRDGYTDLGNTVSGPTGDDYSLSKINSLHAQNRDVLIALGESDNDGTADLRTGPGVFGYSESTNEWQRIGNAQASEVFTDGLTESEGVTDLDYLVHFDSNGDVAYKVAVSTATTPFSRVRIFDANNVLIANRSLTNTDELPNYNGGQVAAVSSGDNVYIYYQDTSSDIASYVIDMTEPQEYGSAGTTFAGTFAVPQAREVSGTTDHILSYVDTAANTLTTRRITTAQSSTWTNTNVFPAIVNNGVAPEIIVDTANNKVNAIIVNTSGLGVAHASMRLDTGVNLQGQVSITGLNITSSVLFLTAAFETISGSQVVRVYTHQDLGTATQQLTTTIQWDMSAQAVIADTGRALPNRTMASRAFSHDQRAYVWCRWPSVTDGMYFLQGTKRIEGSLSGTADVEQVIVATALRGRTDDRERTTVLPRVFETRPGKFETSVLEITFASATLQSQTSLTIDLEPAPLPSSQLGSTLEIAGGVMNSVSKISTELGHLAAPVINSATAVAATNGFTTGDHTVTCAYVWKDSDNNLHRSEPSLPVSVNIPDANTQDISMDVAIPLITNRTTPIRLLTYVTTTTGTTGFQIDLGVELDPLATTLADNTTFTLNGVPDTSLIALTFGPVLYTSVGELGAGFPPPTHSLVSRRDRYFCIPSDNRRVVRFTKPRVSNIAPEWSQENEIPVFGRDDLVAVTVMDDRVILFERDRILWFAGIGPNSNGVGAFTKITEISSNVGCEDRTSILETRDGIVFKSKKGIYLLDRSLQTHYIGSAVEDDNGSNVFSVANLEEEREYRFIIGSDTGESFNNKKLLIYDAYHKQWYRDDFSAILTSTDTLLASTVWKQHYMLAALDGSTIRILQEESPRADASITQTFQDNTTNYTMKARTGWIRPGGINGYVRMRWLQILGDWKSAHNLVVRIFADEDDVTPIQRVKFEFSSDPGDYQPRVTFKKQKVSAIIVEIEVSGAQEAVSWNGLTFQVGTKGGVRRVGADRTK